MLRLTILLMSIIGYYLFYRVRLRLSSYFFPITFISFVSVIVYIGGLFNRLKEGGYAAIAFGIISGVISAFVHIKSKERIDIRSILKEPALWFFIIAVAWAYVITGTMSVSHADDFGHWYRICRIMNYDGSFTDAPDLTYRTYVPGTAVWIFFVTRFTGFSVHNCFFAQSLLYAACGEALFSIIGEEKDIKLKWLGGLTLSALYIFMLAADVGVYELLVDTSVATVSLAALLLAVKGKEGKEYFQLILIMSYAALIKTSAILFCAFTVAAWVIFEGYTEKRWKKSGKTVFWTKAVMILIIPLIFNCLYKISLSCYADVKNTTGNLSVNNLIRNISEKTSVHLSLISERYLSEVFRFAGGIAQIRLIWICIVVLFLTALYIKKHYFIRILKYTLGVSFAYLFFLYLTYLFSLSAGEALELVCLYRYIGTLTIYILGITVTAYLSYIIKESEDRRLFFTGSVLAVVLLAGSANLDTGYLWGYDTYVSEEGYSDNLFEDCVKYVPENIYYTEEKSVVIWNPEDYNKNCDERMLPVARIMGMHLRSNNVLIYSLDRFTNGTLSDKEIEEMNRCSCFYTIGDFSEDAESIRKYLNIPHKTLGRTI